MERITYRKTLDVHKNGIQFMLQGFQTADKMSRVVEVSLMASGDAIDFPNERLVALMYVTSPGTAEPSIYECKVVDSKIVYEVLPITTEGITELQIKLIETDENGARSVLASPKFAIEVGKSNAEDEEAEKKPEFTALEEATARAKLVYDKRFIRMVIAEDGTFTAYYADGTTYETDVIARMLVAASTELDLSALVKNGLTSFTADEVAGEIKADLDAEYKDFFAKAVYSTDLMGDYPEARFVYWDENTIATPLKALLTDKTKGFALVMGDGTSNHTALAWCIGEATRTFYSRFISSGVDTGWRDGKIDLSADVSQILPVSNGGTGASTTAEARDKLGVPSKEELEKVKIQHDWNIKENVGVINAESAEVIADCISDEELNTESLDIVMINSGEIYFRFKTSCHYGSGEKLDKIVFAVKHNDNLVYENVKENLDFYNKYDEEEITLPLKVKKGDILSFTTSCMGDNPHSNSDGYENYSKIRSINILANIETAYTYVSLGDYTPKESITADDILNALIGE